MPGDDFETALKILRSIEPNDLVDFTIPRSVVVNIKGADINALAIAFNRSHNEKISQLQNGTILDLSEKQYLMFQDFIERGVTAT